MPRVKRGTHRRASRKKTLALASGFFLTKSKLYRAAQEAVERSLRHGYIGRKHKKLEFRALIFSTGANMFGLCRSDRTLILVMNRHRYCPLQPDHR